MLKGLLVRASLELDEPVARHPALRVSSDGQSSDCRRGGQPRVP